VWPDSAAEEWYARAKLPASVEDWIGKLTDQQSDIQKHCGGVHKAIATKERKIS